MKTQDASTPASQYTDARDATTHEGERRPQFLPWAISSYVPNKYSGPSPPFHLTVDDVNMGTDSYRGTPRSIVSHRILRGFSGTVSVQYLTSWNELEKTCWETEQDLEQYGNVVEHYWAGEPKRVGRENAKYRVYRVQMAKRSQARSAGKVYVPPGHKLSCDPKCSPDMCSPDSIGSYIFLETAGNGWQFAKIMEHGNICKRGGAFWQSGAARYSRARSCSVAIRDGSCDNDDATFDSFPLICIGGCISVMGEVNAAAGRFSFERA